MGRWWVGTIMSNKCGTCEHGHIFKDDITKRICRGAPPQIVVLPTPRGITTQNMWPLVGVGDGACSLHKRRIVIDALNGNVVD